VETGILELAYIHIKGGSPPLAHVGPSFNASSLYINPHKLTKTPPCNRPLPPFPKKTCDPSWVGTPAADEERIGESEQKKIGIHQEQQVDRVAG
jgi:hypothetical protein